MLRAEEALTALYALGYEADESALSVLCRQVESEILIYCGIDELPKELEQCGLRIVCGLYIELLEARGDKAVKSITEGDLSITYDLSLKTKLIERLKGYGAINRYRRLRW